MDQPKAMPIQWEAVRALAMVVGVREAARRMGLSEDRVRQRSHREGWLSTPEAKKAVQLAHDNRVTLNAQKAVTTVSPAALINSEIAALGAKTRLSFARATAKVGEHIAELQPHAILADAGNVKAIAQTADIVHGWKDQAPQVKIRLDVLNGSAEAAPIDVEANVSGDWAEDCPADPLDEY